MLSSGFLLAAVFSGQAHAATLVAAGSNLTPILNAATSTDHDFKLQGNVTLGVMVEMNDPAGAIDRRVLFIDGEYAPGQRAIITRSGLDSRFNVNTANDVLTIQNAVVTGNASSGGRGAILISANNTTLNLDNTLFTQNTATGHSGGAITLYGAGINATVNGNIAFTDNTATADAGGAIGVDGVGGKSTLTFTGETTFERNSAVTTYGGALEIYDDSTVVFEKKAVFRGNYVTAYFGGAVDVWSGKSRLTFNADVEFDGNYVKNTATHTYGVRGGAVCIGYIVGSAPPQLEVLGTATFTNNYVWGRTSTPAFGGALCLISAADNPGIVAPPVGWQYAAQISTGIFENNIAYSESGKAYGGAVYAKTLNAGLTFGSGSRFTNNYAGTQGGAIYFDQGTLNLNGNVVFQGNRQGASFSTTGGKLAYVNGTGTPNAIYFGVSSNTATLNLNTPASSERIQFYDPITATTDKTVTVNKTGAGAVTFYDYDSNFRAKTTVSGGTFELLAGAAYGAKGTAASNSAFTLNKGAILHGGAGSTLRAWQFTLDGEVLVDAGAFKLETGSAVTLGSDSILSLSIENSVMFSQVELTIPAGLNLNGTLLQINAVGYVPSLDVSDVFVIIKGLSSQANGQFAQGEIITINDADFAIDYNAGNITLRQLTVPSISVP
ncbi:MAG: hypothetical protein LBV28_03235, partial [Puniceicoccales bacterium]|nr:hypothetical protein [Puniceicoccales bacterium]